MVFLPYSPRWLLERQRWSEAREVFFAVRRRPANSKCCSGKQSLKSSETSQNGAPNVEAAREFETMLATYRRDSSGFDTESSGVAGDAGDIASALTPQTGERVQQNPDASVVHDFQNTVRRRCVTALYFMPAVRFFDDSLACRTNRTWLRTYAQHGFARATTWRSCQLAVRCNSSSSCAA